MLRRIIPALFVVTLISLGARQEVRAQQFVYEFVNPAFGGNYLNYSWLLQSAQLQKRFDEDERLGYFDRDPLADFQNSLQRQILSELSRELVYNRFGDQLDLTQQGRYELGDYIIDIVPGSQGVDVKVFNKLTGDESVVTIPTF